MRRSLAIVFLGAAGSFMNSSAQAEWRCDCTTIIDSCSAQVSVRDTFVEVSAPGAQCARVDYFIDGLPFVSVAVDGSAREHWIARGDDPRVLVQGCQVCVDNAGSAPTAAAPSAASATPATPAAGSPTTAFEPLVAPEPVYPREAQLNGVEGSVTVEFTVNPFGDTQNVRVVSSRPAAVFDLAAISAVSRWRYPADGDREPISVTETLEFSLENFQFSDIVSPRPQPAGGVAQTRPGNQCVRESISYNYGEMIEVGLISACNEPLAVFACSAGTGAVAQRWVCTSTEDNGIFLVRPGDSRLGTSFAIPTQAGQRNFRYAENFFVARAPNTEYWWIACASDDSDCTSGARQWSASLDRQATQIDPQLLTRLGVARSY